MIRKEWHWFISSENSTKQLKRRSKNVVMTIREFLSLKAQKYTHTYTLPNIQKGCMSMIIIHLFPHSFSKYLLSIFYEPDFFYLCKKYSHEKRAKTKPRSALIHFKSLWMDLKWGKRLPNFVSLQFLVMYCPPLKLSLYFFSK